MRKQIEKVIALVGDVHGYHHRMVSMLYRIERKKRVSIDQVLQVGDFEAHRHEDDLSTMAAPTKYRNLGDFNQYYSGKRDFPWPIHFIGGNHEPYGWYDEHINGSQLITNCYYLGRVGFLEIRGYKVIGLSGIFHPEKFNQERPSIKDIRSETNKNYIYYTVNDMEKAMSYKACDILLLHDWPKGIIDPKDLSSLTGKHRSNYPEEIGNEYTFMLIEELKPKVVACGHMHYKYRNTIKIGSNITEICCMGNIESGSNAVILLDENLAVIE